MSLLRFRLTVIGVALATAAVSSEAASADGQVRVKPVFQVGVTYEQYSIDSWSDPAAAARAKGVLRTLGRFQNQHIMGWGATSPEPSPGVFDWGRLDERMGLIRETGGTPVITLCCAPDWMKGGRPGQTDWSRLDVAPLPQHFQDYADLALRVAQRYPDVRYFQVWNEFKGFWNSALNRWDFEGYTQLYNRVYDTLKAYNPALQIGGPYVHVVSWRDPSAGGFPSNLQGDWGIVDQRALDAINYWLANKRGAEFVTIDAGMSTRDGFFPGAAVGPGKYAAITQWLRQRTTLPLWWAEYYVELGPNPPDSSPDAVRAVLSAMREAGASVALWWQPQCTDNPSNSFPCTWTSTHSTNGGTTTPYTPVAVEFSGR